MAGDVRTGWCRACQRRTMLQRRGINHVLHLLLSIFTAGIWLVVWIGCALVREPWVCGRCGSKFVLTSERRIAIDEARAFGRDRR